MRQLRLAHPLRLRLKLATVLSITLAVLVATPTVLVAGIALLTAFNNTTRLLDERSQLFRSALLARTAAFLDPAEAAATFVAGRLERGELSADNQDAITDALSYALAAAPQLNAMSYASEQGWLVTAFRRQTGEVGVDRSPWRDDPITGPLVAQAQADGMKPRWQRPVFIPQAEMTVVSFAHAVQRGGTYTGSILASVRLDSLSRFIEALTAPLRQQLGVELFVLYDRQYVLAHPRLLQPKGLLTSLRPVPLVAEVGDPVLAQIWGPADRDRLLFSNRPGHTITVNGQGYAFFYEPLKLASQAQWLVGGYLPVSGIGAEMQHLVWTGVVAVVALILAIVTALWLARRITRPASELALASERVARIDFDRVPVLARSHLAEVDAAARAFNSMVGAIRLFLLYAPAKLVRALIDEGESAVRSERRTLTVLFTDIAGFTAAAEQMTAEAAAALLNAHHTLVMDCVEAEGGTVDKLIGDGLMAFWNAPEPQPDHADRGLHAVLAIREQILAANSRAESPVRLRMGLHTGPAVVGNIGSPSRLSYTIVGDTVNVASRLEDLNRDLQPEAEVGILLSGETMAALKTPVPLCPLGQHPIRGRAAPIELYTPEG